MTDLHLRSITLDRSLPLPDGFPFHIPVIHSLLFIELDTPITFFVGENGSGKSTLLEAIAAAAQMITVGSVEAHKDATLADVQRLAARLKLSWSKRTRRGFFMRSEDFFGFVKKMAQTRAELQNEIEQVDKDYAERSATARGLAKMAYARELGSMQLSYGEGLDAGSHGESFFTLFQARFVPNGLYILDEPEAPLSPTRQLAFMTMLNDMVAKGAQFLIATHSPILLAFPNATIYSCDGGTLQKTAYDALEHVQITRDFLLHPDAYLRRLLE